ncbi:unnamed protein product [Caenorhabditis angaria]|uniref:Uncharacterized protein n=1 Tax=Caenorhabditis angaria TaxID=860376 RepID=A0A9P1N6M9_9PELO|nr:unnamed protein product [Caenorhabditis angaria]
MRGFLIFGAIFAVILAQNCTWTNWSSWTTCSENCGNCGTQKRLRTCANSTIACATCQGNSSESQMCNAQVCVYPKSSCCFGAPASVDGLFQCSLT